jgi:hypothetical protein
VIGEHVGNWIVVVIAIVLGWFAAERWFQSIRVLFYSNFVRLLANISRRLSLFWIERSLLKQDNY